MNFKRFSFFIALRTLLIIVTLFALSSAVNKNGYHVATLVVTMLLLLQAYLLVNFVSKTNEELVRFLDAARYADYTQKFELSPLGSGFGELGKAFSDILERFQSVRNTQEEQLRHLKAIVEHVPVPLLSFDDLGNLTLWNNTARKLFGSNHVTKLQDLDMFGDAFGRQIREIKVGEKHLFHFNVDGMEHQLSVCATQILLTHQQETLVSLQDIQNELDNAQLQAWQDLVKVLTHEIMNSITPVASLANTTVDLVADVKKKSTISPELNEDLSDIAEAVETVARRSDGLIKFVNSYRRLTRLPTPNKKQIPVAKIFRHCRTLGTKEWERKGIQVDFSIEPSELDLVVDNDMLSQVLLNLLQNAEHAVEHSPSPRIELNAHLNKRGHVVIEVCDNGKGITKEVANNLFVPFYTTKHQGSGVGLALSRQIMLAHGGAIKYREGDKCGAVFRLTF
jgi:nitrogen fixation/metabolism regulation signal transduction histidine kinase